MKTQFNLSNLKKVAVTLCSTLVITTASFAVSIPEASKTAEKLAHARLELLMNATERSLHFVAPAADVSEELNVAFANLDQLAENTQATLRYEAPEVIETVNEIENLDNLALVIEADLKYKAPAADETENTEAEIARLDQITAATIASLAYKAPAATDTVDEVPAEAADYFLASDF